MVFPHRKNLKFVPVTLVTRFFTIAIKIKKISIYKSNLHGVISCWLLLVVGH